MPNKSQIMQIGIALNNPALVARMMRDHKTHRPRNKQLPNRLSVLLETPVGASTKFSKRLTFSYRSSQEGWVIDWFLDSNFYRTCYYNDEGFAHKIDGPAIVFKDGSVAYYENGVIHRDGDDPAVINVGQFTLGLYADQSNSQRVVHAFPQSKIWMRNGLLHRNGQPAQIGPHIEVWAIFGKLHRGGKPARFGDSENGLIWEEWYDNGLRHREEGPAVTQMSGTQMWYLYGKLHREDGPAIDPGKTELQWKRSWYVHGRPMKEEEYKSWQHQKFNDSICNCEEGNCTGNCSCSSGGCGKEYSCGEESSCTACATAMPGSYVPSGCGVSGSAGPGPCPKGSQGKPWPSGSGFAPKTP